MNKEQNKPSKYGGLIKKSPKLGMSLLVLVGISIIYYSTNVYTQIRLLEQGIGDDIRVPRFIVKLYELFGAWGVTLFFVFGGLFFLYLAYDVYRTMIKK